jgi:hypothetical protein
MVAKVKVGKKYIYNPNGLDLFCPKTNVESGTIVKVGNLPSAPKANTMGQCYIFDVMLGNFLGMVSVSSLDEV